MRDPQPTTIRDGFVLLGACALYGPPVWSDPLMAPGLHAQVAVGGLDHMEALISAMRERR